MINLIIILLYAIGNQFEISLIGKMSISDIGVLLYFIYLPTNRQLVRKLTQDKDVIYITFLFLALIIIQIFSETMLSNNLINSVKCIAVSILSYLKFIFLWSIVTRKNKNLWYLFLFSTIAILIFKRNNYSVSTEDISTKIESMGYLKFYIAPLIGDILVIITLIFNKKLLYPIFIIAGIIIIILGARSYGLIIFLTGIIALYITTQKIINKLSIIRWGLFLSLCCYILYIVYANAVLSGTITSGNSGQIKQLKNPYNPIEALFMGRSENIASLTAISDSPWFGWGAWTNDVEYKYHILISRSKGEIFDKSNVDYKVIPTHSVILGVGVNNGVFAMLFTFLIIFFFCKRGIISLNKNNPYLYLTIYSVLLLIWHGLFSPVSHMRYSFPNYFVYCLFSYKYYLLIKRQKKIQFRRKIHQAQLKTKSNEEQ